MNIDNEKWNGSIPGNSRTKLYLGEKNDSHPMGDKERTGDSKKKKKERERGGHLPVPAAPSLNTASLWREMERVAVSSRRARTSSGISSGSRRRRVTSPPPPPPWPPPPPGLVDAEYMNTDPYPCNDCNGSLTPPTSPTGPWKKKKNRRAVLRIWFFFPRDYIERELILLEWIFLEKKIFRDRNWRVIDVIIVYFCYLFSHIITSHDDFTREKWIFPPRYPSS